MRVFLRTPETEERYKAHIARGGIKVCPLCHEEPLQQFTYWKILTNAFPYDKVFQTHHLLVPMRHVAEEELNEAERAELQTIKNDYIGDHYQSILEQARDAKSIPGHFHLHLVVFKDF